MTKTRTKRMLSLLVAVVMVMTLLPVVPAMAAGELGSSSNPCVTADNLAEVLGRDNVDVTENKVTLKNSINLKGDLYIQCKGLTLDLSEYTITLTNGDCTIFIDDDATITGTTGKIEKANAKWYALYVRKGATLTITGGTFTYSLGEDPQTKEIILVDEASLNMSGGTLETDDCSAIFAQKGSTVTISDTAKITSTCADVALPAVVLMGVAAPAEPNGSSLTMSGGEIKSAGACIKVQNEGSKVTVTGGKIVNTDASGIAAVQVTRKATLEMTAGEISTAGQAVYVGSTDDDDAGDQSIGTTATIGGNAKISRTSRPGYGLLQVKEYGILNIEGEAKIEDTVVVFENGELNIHGGTITSAGHAVATNGSAEGSPNTSKGAKITIDGGTITGADDSCGIYAPAGTWTIKGDAKISGGAGIVVRGGDLDVQGGTIAATGTGKITVGDATKNGDRYEVPAAGITVDNAGYPEQEKGQPHVSIGGEATVKAAEGGKTLAACENGTPVDAPAGKVAPEDNPFSVSGGTFTTGTDTADNTSVDQFLADGYSYTKESGITYTNTDNAEVTLDGVYYETLEKAIAAAGNNSVIELKKNVEIKNPIAISNGGALTIDLGTYNITRTGGEARVIQVTNGSLTIEGEGTLTNEATESATKKDLVIVDGTSANAELTINGGTFEQTIDNGAIFVQNKAKVTLNKGTIKGIEETTKKSPAVQVSSTGTFNMTGGTITGGFAAVTGYDAEDKITISGGKLTGTEVGVSAEQATVEINGNAEVSGKVGVYAGKGATLTVSGNAKITGTGTDAESGIEVAGDGTIAEIKENAQVSGAYGIYAKDKAKLTVSGGTVTGTAAGIGTNGDDKDTPADITVSGGTVSGDIVGVYLPSGTMTVQDGADISGQAGIVQFGGELTVEGGTITANGTADVEIGNSGQAVPPAAVVTNKQAGYDENVKADLKGGNFTAAEGQPAVTYTESGKSAQPAAGTFTVEGGTYKTGTEADVSVYQYVGDDHAVDPKNGTVGAKAEVSLAIIDFGYIDKLADAGLAADGKFTSDKGIQYNADTAQWTDATFYWCFNRALADSESVEITLTAPNGKTYTDTCEGDGVSARYAASFLSETQFGDDVEKNGIVTGDYKISGTVDATEVKLAADVAAATVEDLPETMKDEVVVAAAPIVDKADDPTGTPAAEVSVEYIGKTVAEGATTYNIKGVAKNLKKHTNEAGKEGYWFGIEIKAPIEPAADAEYEVSGAVTGKSTFDTLEAIEGNPKGAIIYFDAGSADADGVYTITIKWDATHTYTYSIDLTTVERYGAAKFVEGGVGFMAKADNKTLNDLAPKAKGDNATWGENGITDCVDNTFYAAFTLDPQNTEGKSYTVKFADKDGHAYSATASSATKGGIVYFTPAWQDGTGTLPTADYQGEYTVTVTKTGDATPDDTATIKVYQVVYQAENGKFAGDVATVNSGIYAGSLAEAETLTATKPEVTPDAGYTAAVWGEAVVSETDYTITYTATCAEEPPKPDTAQIKAVGFITVDEDGNDILNKLAPQVKGEGETWGENGITDCVANTLYAAFNAANETGATYTVKFTKGEKSYEQTVENVTKGGLAYVSFDDQAKEAFGAEPQGEYTVELWKDGARLHTAGDKIQVYQVKYTAGTGVTGEDAVVYTDAKGLEAAKTARPAGFDLASGTDRWNDNEAETDGYTVTVTLSGHKTSSGSPSSSSSSSSTTSVKSASAVNGSFTVSNRSAKAGETVKITPKANEGYTVDQVTVTGKGGENISVTKNADGTYSFVMPAKAAQPVTVAVTFKADEDEKDCPSEKFTDVEQDQWYHEGVDYVVKNGLMDGVGGDLFAPNATTTRAMVVTILYRLEGEPAVTRNVPFADVPAGQWFSNAIIWAAGNGIVNGYSETQFGLNDPITREQMAAILYRYAQYKGYDVSKVADLSGYTDAGSVSDWAVTAMRWTVDAGLIQGVSATTLSPTGDSTRAQVATILMRYCEGVAK